MGTNFRNLDLNLKLVDVIISDAIFLPINFSEYFDIYSENVKLLKGFRDIAGFLSIKRTLAIYKK